MRIRTSIAATIAALALPAAAGCSWFGGEEDLDVSEHEGRLTEMFNESARLNEELDEAEARIVQDCLEAQGFSIHDSDQFDTSVSLERESVFSEPQYEGFLPTVEEAEVRGFWQWTNADGAEEAENGELWTMWLEHQASRFGAEWVEMIERDELPEFFHQSPEDQYAWYVAYYGEELAAEQQGDLVGIERETDEYGEEVYTNPPPGGCRLEMITGIYGELGATENEEEGWTDWIARPDPPTGDGQEISDRYFAGIASVEPEFLDCVEDRGWGRWEFHNGWLSVNDFLEAAGSSRSAASYEGAEDSFPEPPDDVPAADDFEGWLAFERGMAVDFAECGDESGFRQTADEAWRRAELVYLLDIEAETYAWQEEMQGYLANAQELLES